MVLEKEDLEGIKLKTNNTVEVKEFIESEEFVKILNVTNKVAIGK